MPSKSRVIRILQEAYERKNGSGNYIFRLFILTIPLVVLIATGSAVVAHYNKARADNMHKAQQMENLEEMLHNTKIAALYAMDIDIRKIRTTEIPEGGIFLRGEIKSRSRSAFMDIGLTIYGLDEDKRPVYFKDIMTQSSDGLPLTWHKRRSFSAVLDDAPQGIDDLVVIVNSVDIITPSAAQN